MANYETLAKIIEARNITPYRIAKETGLTTVLFTDWKKGKSTPKYPKLKAIADYLDIPVECLQDDNLALAGISKNPEDNPPVDLTFYSRFYELCLEKGFRPQSEEIIDIAGVSSPAITGWKRGALPKAEILIRIASYFNVSVDYLLGLTDERSSSEKRENLSDVRNHLTEQENVLLRFFRAADETGKMRIIQAVMNEYDLETSTHIRKEYASV